MVSSFPLPRLFFFLSFSDPPIGAVFALLVFRFLESDRNPVGDVAFPVLLFFFIY